MNREEAKLFLPLIQAFSEGKTIQVAGTGTAKQWVDLIGHDIYFGGNPTNLRIKPEAEVVYAVISLSGHVESIHKYKESAESRAEYINTHSSSATCRVAKFAEEV